MEKFSRLMPNDFASKIWEKGVFLIDLRTPQEKSMFWYIDNTDYFYNIYDNDIQEKLDALDKAKTYLLYCYHWTRSGSALVYMRENGFENAHDLIWWTEYWKNYWFELVN